MIEFVYDVIMFLIFSLDLYLINFQMLKHWIIYIIMKLRPKD
ncbi:hypothetical protein BN1080_00957 [Planococcus massiliensis]|uniref:Uncharacterized protein n=1 Tax=Planococcus massiliensis TaxID=1499687 RepID=A0A098EJP0_9BACL|nr:hypothetical protein BN1080_00957 [Planococcus massiliensis]